MADWITAPDNRWFSRMAVNRMWAHLFGRGLVDPLDDFSATNPASHPQLLDELAEQFVAHQFDLKFLLRAADCQPGLSAHQPAGPSRPQ